MTDNPVIIAIVVCFAVGYWAVSVLLKKRGVQQASSKEGQDRRPFGGEKRDSYSSIEGYYRKVLCVSESAGEEEIRAAYRSQLAKYHPDKVTHLGDEFYNLASRRTKEIIEAYDFLKRQYEFK